MITRIPIAREIAVPRRGFICRQIVHADRRPDAPLQLRERVDFSALVMPRAGFVALLAAGVIALAGAAQVHSKNSARAIAAVDRPRAERPDVAIFAARPAVPFIATQGAANE